MKDFPNVKTLFEGQFDGVLRFFNLFLERDVWPQDSVYDRIVAIRDKLAIRDYRFTENEKYMIPIIGLMVVSYGLAIIEDTTDEVKKQELIDDFIAFEAFLQIYSPDQKTTIRNGSLSVVN